MYKKKTTTLCVLASKQTTKDTVNSRKLPTVQKALYDAVVIRQHFSPSSELLKELNLFTAIVHTIFF